jgi:baculoviral IAP repeat-containing protein 6
MAEEGPWVLSEDGCLNIETDSKTIIYHPNLNIILVSTISSEIHVIDVNSGVVLQKSALSGTLHVEGTCSLARNDLCSGSFVCSGNVDVTLR